jgi:hypothetical protein
MPRLTRLKGGAGPGRYWSGFIFKTIFCCFFSRLEVKKWMQNLNPHVNPIQFYPFSLFFVVQNISCLKKIVNHIVNL